MRWRLPKGNRLSRNAKEHLPRAKAPPRPCSLQPPALTLHRVAPLAVASRWVGWAGWRGAQGPWLSSYLLMDAQSRSPQWHEVALASEGSLGNQNCGWRHRSPSHPFWQGWRLHQSLPEALRPPHSPATHSPHPVQPYPKSKAETLGQS